MLLFIGVSCSNSAPESPLSTKPITSKDSLKVYLNIRPIIAKDSLKGPYNLFGVKFKRTQVDTTVKVYYRKDFTNERDLLDVFALKRGDSILIVQACIGCMFTVNSFVVSLKNNNYSCHLSEGSCTYSIDFTPYEQKLILSDSTYQPGDTISGYINYVGRYSPDSLSRFYEEAHVRGSFKTVLRDSIYDFRMDRKNRLKDLKKDTIEIRRRWPKLFGQ